MRRLVLLLACLAPAASAAAQDVRVRASVNGRRIGIEDVLELEVTIDGGQGRPQLPRIEGFRVSGPSTSSRVQVVNGQMSATTSYIYQLLPAREGSFVIPAIPVDVGGETYRTEPIEIEVVSGSVLPRRPRGGGLDPWDSFGNFPRRRRPQQPQIGEKDVFLRAEVSKRSPYQGEAVVVTYRVFSKYLPHGPQIDDDPALSGFWVEEVDLGSPSVERTVVDGEEYLSFPLKQRIVFPTRAGELVIPPLTLSMAFRMTSGDPFDALFARASQPVSVRSSPVRLDVKPLPAKGRPRGFSGAVGRFELNAALSQDSVEAGDPVTLTLAIEGRGNLRTVELPRLADTPGFRTFDPKMEETLRAHGSGLEGKKSWEYVLVPESSGEKELGPWRFSYFDPERGRYVETKAGPLSLRVSGTAAAAAAGGNVSPVAAGGREVELLGQDIRYLKDAPDRLGTTSRPFYRSGLFYASLLLPLLWNAGLVVYIKRKEKEAADAPHFRRRRAEKMARERLGRAKRLAVEGSKTFYEEVAAALYRYVGDKTSRSPSGLTSQEIDRLLEEAGIDAALRRRFLDLLDTCEEARFTPGERGREEMEPLLERARELVVTLEKAWA